jgi:hypothetical protein
MIEGVLNIKREILLELKRKLQRMNFFFLCCP